jgi:hypothetical protein
MRLQSIYWNEKYGVCEKHWLPQVPCLQCIATNDPDMELRPTTEELAYGFTIEELMQDFERVDPRAR